MLLTHFVFLTFYRWSFFLIWRDMWIGWMCIYVLGHAMFDLLLFVQMSHLYVQLPLITLMSHCVLLPAIQWWFVLFRSLLSRKKTMFNSNVDLLLLSKRVVLIFPSYPNVFTLVLWRAIRWIFVPFYIVLAGSIASLSPGACLFLVSNLLLVFSSGGSYERFTKKIVT